MGGIFSSNRWEPLGDSSSQPQLYKGSPSGTSKQQRVAWCFKHNTILIPCLLKMEALSSTLIYKLRRELNTAEELRLIICRVEENLLCYALDPVSQKWQKLPQDESQFLKCNSTGSRIKNAEAFGVDPLDKIALYGCSIGAVSGCLYVIGDFSRTMTLRWVWRYNPILNIWNEVIPMPTSQGYSYSTTFGVNNKLYVVEGLTTPRGRVIAFRSADVFDPKTNEWSTIPSMPCSTAQVMAINMIAGRNDLNITPTDLTPYKGLVLIAVDLIDGIFSLNRWGPWGDSSCHRHRYKGLPSGTSKQQRSTILIPCLPNDISLEILARVPRVYYLQLKLVSRTWMEALSSTLIYKLRRELNTTEELLFILCREEENLVCYALDPVSQKWQKLPPLPQDEPQFLNCNSSGSRIKNAEAFGVDPLDKIPLYGCSIGAINGCLYVIGGFSRTLPLDRVSGTPHVHDCVSRTMTLRCVWRYDPILNIWNEVSPMLTSRGYSKTAVVNNKLYVVGGLSTTHRGRMNTLTALRSAEVFDPVTNEWSAIPSMPCSTAQAMAIAMIWGHKNVNITATDLTPYKGKLYALQGSIYWPYCNEVGGERYDPETNSWVEMSIGMFDHWPSKETSNKSSVVIDDELYALDVQLNPCRSFGSAKIEVYDRNNDSWKVVSEVPKPYSPTNLECPCLLAGFGGKLHVVMKDANSDIAVLEAPSHSSHSNTKVSWKVIASMRAEPVELITSQVLRI